MNYLELVAAILGLISVYFVVRRNVWAFPIGIVMVGLYFVIFYEARFYADMFLQLVYIVMQAQGWYLWLHGARASDNKIAIRRLSRQQWMLTGLLVAAGTFLAGFFLKKYTNAALPYIDALTTAVSLMAQWWMNKKFLENWTLWILVDVIYLYQYSAKALYLTTGLYAAFLVLAIMGYQQWKREEFAQESSAAQV